MHHLHRPPRFTKHKTHLLDTCTFIYHRCNICWIICWIIFNRYCFCQLLKNIREVKNFYSWKINTRRGLGYTYEGFLLLVSTKQQRHFRYSIAIRTAQAISLHCLRKYCVIVLLYFKCCKIYIVPATQRNKILYFKWYKKCYET